MTIISHKHKFIYTRVTKTGSSSVQMMFDKSGILDDNDVMAGYYDNIKDGPIALDKNVPEYTWNDIHRISKNGIPKGLDDPKKLHSGIQAYLSHFPVSEMIDAGLISEQQLYDYDAFGFFREPVDRWVSGYFFIRRITKSQRDPVQDMTWKIENNRYDFPIFMNRRQQEHFLHKGKIVATPYDYADMISVIQQKIVNMGGKVIDTPSLKSFDRPNEFRVPAEEFLPSSALNLLKHKLADEIEFYENHVVRIKT